MQIKVNFFMCDVPELFLPIADWNEYFPGDSRPDYQKEAVLHLTAAQFKGLLRQNAELSKTWEWDDPLDKQNKV